jgi:predicted nucleotidyltransferase
MIPWDPAEHVLVVQLAGSQAHGTAGPGSDVDLRGVCVAPLPVRVSLFDRFEQQDGALGGPVGDAVLAACRAHPSARDGLDQKTEWVTYDVSKFLTLCGAANPNALELLFGDPTDRMYEAPGWRSIHDVRHHFLTRRVESTFSGYALGQLRRIASHRAWLLNPPKARPTRAQFGLPEFSPLSKEDTGLVEALVALRVGADGAAPDTEEARDEALRSLALPAEIGAIFRAEKAYRAAMRTWDSYESWRTQRNPARAALERAHGYDTKHAMHLVRLLREGIEVLERGDLEVRRQDADELRAIRDGAWSWSRLEEEVAAMQAELQRVAARSTLPEDIDRAFVDRLNVAVIEAARA